MATKTSHLVSLLSLILLLLFVSSHVGLADGKRYHYQRKKLPSPPIPPTPPRMYVPPSRSRKGKGP